MRKRSSEAVRPQPAHPGSGSTDPAGIDDVERIATMLQSVAAYDDVLVGYVGGADPDLATTITDAVARGAGTVVVVPYLLGDGHFAGLVRDVQREGVVVTAPLGAHAGVIDLVLLRYDAARQLVATEAS